MNTINLYEYALAKAKESAEKHELLAVAAAARVKYRWLCMFAKGEIPGAAYGKVHQLATWYMQRELEDATAPTTPASPPLEQSAPPSAA